MPKKFKKKRLNCLRRNGRNQLLEKILIYITEKYYVSIKHFKEEDIIRFSSLANRNIIYKS